MTTKAKAKTTVEPYKKPDQYELEHAPYLINPEKRWMLARNYDLLPTDHAVDNNMILDWLELNDLAEAKRIRGWLWNAFAAGIVFQKDKAKSEVK